MACLTPDRSSERGAWEKWLLLWKLLGKDLVFTGSSGGHCWTWVSWETVLALSEQEEAWKHRAHSHWLKPNRINSGRNRAVVSHGWEDVDWMVCDVGTWNAWYDELTSCLVFSGWFNTPTPPPRRQLEQWWPAYRHTGLIVASPLVVKPTQGCRPSPAHLLPSCPVLALDQRQAAHRGTGLMTAAAIPSLLSSSPGVQF